MSAAKSRAIFDEDDDSDSIASDTTADSETAEEYSVEKILCDRRSDQGQILYLVKWEGYPLHRATWEPKESFVSPDVIPNWRLEKREIRNGNAEPFDVARFDEAVRREHARSERHRLKREEKRRKRATRRLLPRAALKKGIARRPDPAVSLSNRSASRRDSTPLFFESPSPTQSIRKKRKRTASNSPLPSPTTLVDDVETSQNSLFNEPATIPQKTPSKSPPPAPKTASKRPRVESLSGPVLSIGAQTSKQRSDIAPSEPKVTSSTSTSLRKPSSNEVPSKTKTQVNSKKPDSNNVSNQVAASSNPRTDASSSTQSSLQKSSTTPSLSRIPRTTTSSTTAAPRRASDGIPAIAPVNDSNKRNPNSVTAKQLPGSKNNETAVAVSTGPSATGPASAAISKTPGPSRRPIKLFMDNTQPARQRARVNENTPKGSTDAQFRSLSVRGIMQKYSHNEPAPDPNALTFIDPNTGKSLDSGAPSATNGLRPDINVGRASELATSANSVPVSETRTKFAYPSARPSSNLSKQITCRFWQRGTCARGDYCPHAHYDTGRMERKKPIICSYWESGNCKFSAEDCEYMHGQDDEEFEAMNGHQAFQRQPRQIRPRSESPDNSGLRQDEVERRDRSNLAQIKARHDGSSPAVSPFTATFEQRTAPLQKSRSSMQLDRQTHDFPPPVTHMPDVTMVDVGTLHDLVDPSLTDNMATVETEPASNIEAVKAGFVVKPTSTPTCTTEVELAFDSVAGRTKLTSTVGERPLLECSEMCRSRDFETYWFQADKAWASGSMLRAPDQSDSTISDLEDYLLLHSAGCVVRTQDYVLLVYATNTPIDWKFLPNKGPEKSGLRWYLQEALPDTLEPIVTNTTKNSFKSMCAEHLGLDENILFLGNNGKSPERKVYLFFPQNVPETKLVEWWMADANAQICWSHDSSLWTQFLKEGKAANRVIIFHPSMNQFWKVPDFSSVLSSSANIFQLGVSKPIKARLDSQMKYTCTRLFPTGTLTLITDDIFLHHPAMALRILQSFEGVKHRPEGGRFDRIYCRPGLLTWLAELIDEDREKKILIENSPRIKVFRAACELFDTPATDTTSNPYRLDTSPPTVLYSSPKSHMPQYGSLWDSSEEEATDYLVERFAGHCVDECESYRRFTVLYEQHGGVAAQTPGLREYANPKDPRGWMVKFRHLRVTTPNRWLVDRENYEKQKQRSRV